MTISPNEQLTITIGATAFVLLVAIYLLRWLDRALSDWLELLRAELVAETAKHNAIAELLRTVRERREAEFSDVEPFPAPADGRDHRGRFLKGKCANPNGRRGKGDK